MKPRRMVYFNDCAFDLGGVVSVQWLADDDVRPNRIIVRFADHSICIEKCCRQDFDDLVKAMRAAFE